MELVKRKPGARVDQLLAEMSVLAEASAAKMEHDSGRQHADSSPPPGAFSGQQSTADEGRALVNRLADVMEVELARVRGGGVPREIKDSQHREDKNKRILEVWFPQGKSNRWISYVEDLPEKVVMGLRRLGREAA